MGTLAAAGRGGGGGGAGGGEVAVSKQDSSSSAAAFVEGGVQDVCDDSCSICLEPFCHSEPATVTSCNHEFHVQCILEWAQRSKECPMCWQSLSLKDPSSQELLDAVEHEQPWTNLEEVSAFANYAEFEERIMQHLAHQMVRRQNRPMSLLNNQVEPVGTTNLQPAHEAQQIGAITTDAASHNNWNGHVRSHRAQRHHLNLDRMQESQQRSQSSDTSLVSDSLKSRFLVASSKCKETLTRTTRSFKERLRGRNNKTADFRARAQEVSAEVVRQALKRISPESVEKEDVPSTSTSPTSHGGITESIRKPGARSQTTCTTNNHREGGIVIGVSSVSSHPSEAAQIHS